MFAPSTPMRRGFAIALATVLVTSGCAAGRDAQTQNQVPSQDGTNADAGTMALRGLSLEAPTTGNFWKSGSAVPVRLVLVNNGTSNDQLTNIVTSVARGWAGYPTAAQASRAAAAQTSKSTPGSSAPSSSSTSKSAGATPPTYGAETSVTVPAGQRVSWGVPDSKRVLLLLSSIGRLYPGSSVKLTFTFSKAGSVSVTVPVQTSDDPGDSVISGSAGSDG